MLTRTLGPKYTRAVLTAFKRGILTVDESKPGSTTHFDGLGPAHVQMNIFNPDPQFTVQKRLIGPFGTINEPTKVYSPKPYRIVGCTGSHDKPHSIGWFVMEGYLKHMCPQCGQMFQLTNNPDELETKYLEKADPDAHFLSGH